MVGAAVEAFGQGRGTCAGRGLCDESDHCLFEWSVHTRSRPPPQLCAGGEKPSELGWHVALIPQCLLAQLWGKRSRKGRSQEPFREGRAGSGRAGRVGDLWEQRC